MSDILPADQGQQSHLNNLKWLISIILFVVIFLSYLPGIFNSTSDIRWVIPTALSVIEEGNLDLNEYGDLLKADDYSLVTSGDHVYSLFPYGSSILSIPPAQILLLICKRTPFDFRIGSGLSICRDKGMERVVASFFVALTAVIVFLICSIVTSIGWSLLICGIFSYCTPAWSTASRGLWQHGPSMLLLSIILLLLLRIKPGSKWIVITGILLMSAYIVRPTNSISLGFFSLYLLIRSRRAYVWFLAGIGIILIPFLAVNITTFGTILPVYFLPGRIGSFETFPTALLGNLLSPSRGIILFSPVCLLAVKGMLTGIKRNRDVLLSRTLIVIVISHWLAISTFPHWWGGWCFGPRLFTDMMPYIMFFLAMGMGNRVADTKRHLNLLRKSVLILLILISGFIHFQGVFSWDTLAWNSRPSNIDENPERIWDWHDIQFLRGVSRCWEDHGPNP
jgi:hypothetical protein